MVVAEEPDGFPAAGSWEPLFIAEEKMRQAEARKERAKRVREERLAEMSVEEREEYYSKMEKEKRRKRKSAAEKLGEMSAEEWEEKERKKKEYQRRYREENRDKIRRYRQENWHEIREKERESKKRRLVRMSVEEELKGERTAEMSPEELEEFKRKVAARIEEDMAIHSPAKKKKTSAALSARGDSWNKAKYESDLKRLASMTAEEREEFARRNYEAVQNMLKRMSPEEWEEFKKKKSDYESENSAVGDAWNKARYESDLKRLASMSAEERADFARRNYEAVQNMLAQMSPEELKELKKKKRDFERRKKRKRKKRKRERMLARMSAKEKAEFNQINYERIRNNLVLKRKESEAKDLEREKQCREEWQALVRASLAIGTGDSREARLLVQDATLGAAADGGGERRGPKEWYALVYGTLAIKTDSCTGGEGDNEEAAPRPPRKGKSAPSKAKGSKKNKKLDTVDKDKAQAAKETPKASTPATPVLPDKPRKPPSAYNLFYKMEREFIKHEISKGRKPEEDPLIKKALEEFAEAKAQQEGVTKNSEIDPAKKEGSNDKTDMSSLDPAKQPQPGVKGEGEFQCFYDPNIPERYAHLHMDKHWYLVGKKEKETRKDRVNHCHCGFKELVTMVAARWKSLGQTDLYVKQYCQALAGLEVKRYKKEMADYKLLVEKAEKEARKKRKIERRKARKKARIQERKAKRKAKIERAKARKKAKIEERNRQLQTVGEEGQSGGQDGGEN